jgi:phosphatidate cytidylyltransferase
MPRVRRFDWRNLALRIVSGAVLAPAALAIAWRGGALFLILVAVAVSLLSVEWAVMAARPAAARVAVTMTAAVLGVVFLTYAGEIWAALAMMAFGCFAAAAASRGVTERRADAAYGVLYVAPACLAIIWLRYGTPGLNGPKWQGAGWTVMLLATTWAADVCAFAVGNALKGPKLWPRFSPNKTWSGFFGGLVGAAAAAIGVAAFLMHLSLVGAGVIGLAGGLATMMGDLWESMLKRRFGVKDSGDLIPGHGGLLDRVDGLMFATLVFAASRLIVHFGWAH